MPLILNSTGLTNLLKAEMHPLYLSFAFSGPLRLAKRSALMFMELSHTSICAMMADWNMIKVRHSSVLLYASVLIGISPRVYCQFDTLNQSCFVPLLPPQSLRCFFFRLCRTYLLGQRCTILRLYSWIQVLSQSLPSQSSQYDETRRPSPSRSCSGAKFPTSRIPYAVFSTVDVRL